MIPGATPPDSGDTGSSPRLRASIFEVFWVFLRLGCTSFGGPIAHFGYFQKELVARRKWCSEGTLAETIALSQSLPGPSSSQVGFAVGIMRAGLPGGLAAWTGFTLPSALLMFTFAYGHSLFDNQAGNGLLHGLQLVAVAVVAQAVEAMRRTLAPDRMRIVFALLAAGLVLLGPPAFSTPLAIAAGGLCGVLFLRAELTPQAQLTPFNFPKSIGYFALSAFLALLVMPPLVSQFHPSEALEVFSAFYRTGALVFGGGHVVLPLVEHSVVSRGWVTQPAFLAGYGAAQALPGPLFTFAAYLGAVVRPSPSPIAYGLLSLASIFAPGLLAMAGILPFWGILRRNAKMQTAILGINAAVVGVLVAALYHPLWTSTIHSDTDFLIVLIAFAVLTAWKVPSWWVVIGSAAFCVLRSFL